MNVIDLDNRHVRSYATQAMMERMMKETGADKVRHLVCRTPKGRWTCVLIGFQQHLMGKWPMVG